MINRGNYRGWVFREMGAGEAFQECLWQACKRHGWVLHAWVVMGNHFHLAVETPTGNLSAGMQWLQSTFANRFNRFRKTHGHLFQGRFKALLVEEGEALGQVCHYIHLNPVRAGILPVEDLKKYSLGSYRYIWMPRERPGFLSVETALLEPCEAADSAAGWEKYQQYLEWQASEGPLGKTKAYVSLSRGWALGSRDFRKALMKDHANVQETRAWDSVGRKEVQRLRWQEALDAARGRLGVSICKDQRKSAPWRVALAAHLKDTTDVTNDWLASKLKMGSGSYVSKHVGIARSKKTPASALLVKLAHK